MVEPKPSAARPAYRSVPPLFRPFFLGGLGLLAMGVALIFAGPLPALPPSGPDDAMSLTGVGLFLATFGFFLAIVPIAGKVPFRREVIVDPDRGRLILRNRTLLKLREHSYPLVDVHGLEIRESRHVDGEPDVSLLLHLRHAEPVLLDRFTTRAPAERAALSIRNLLPPLPESLPPH